ncbi:MAG: hypothetical protein E7270_07765 [Lachnospiraceae bacterium]|nr:hypothetical protein [Lachnospiraceae bacterium]
MINAPLKELSKILCSKKDYGIFRNQTEMYQLLVTFTANKMTIIDNRIARDVDELIEQIKLYLCDMYELRKNNRKFEKDYSDLHRYIFENIYNIKLDSKKDIFKSDYMDNNISYLKKYETDIANLKSNISKSINNSNRTISHSWFTEYRKYENDCTLLINRMFWLIQYYVVYYMSNKELLILSEEEKREDNRGYFGLKVETNQLIINQLKNQCYNYSSLINISNAESLDINKLSRIILDVLVAHYNCVKKHEIITAYNSEYKKIAPIVPNDIQWKEFITYVDAYGDKTLDRFNMLKKYANKNSLAANELGNLHFYGETFIFGGNNKYILNPDYQKAISYYKMSIYNSNPPLPVACWSLAYIFSEGYNSGLDKEDIELAKKYYTLAGKYPPAYCGLAKIQLKEIEEEYILLNGKNDSEEYRMLVKNFVKALELAGQAADMEWFYGNNIIADFIQKHINDEKLINDIKERIVLTTEFDIEKQLSIACKYDNPWAINALAKYYISMGNKEKANLVINRALEFEFNSAYYTVAMHLSDEFEKKEEALKKALSLGYVKAGYELCKIYYDNKDYKKFKEYYKTTSDQILASKNIDKKLCENLEDMNKKLKGEV